MILTVGHNYCKLNDSPEFYNFMNALWQSAGADINFEYPTGEDFGLPNTQGYQVSDFHFRYLPVGTRFHNLTTGAVTEKISHWNSGMGFQMWGSGTYTHPSGNHTDFFMQLGHEYDIRIPAPHGNFQSGYMSMLNNNHSQIFYDQNFRSDLAAANGYYPQPGGGIRTSLDGLDKQSKYRCGLPFLIPIMEREKSVLHKVFPDIISKENRSWHPDFNRINFESYWVVYGGERKTVQECEELHQLTCANPLFAERYDKQYPNDTNPNPNQLKVSWNINAAAHPAGYNEIDYGLPREYKKHPLGAPNNTQMSGQTPPGITGIVWAGHYPGYPVEMGNINKIFDDGIVDENTPAEENYIGRKELIGPKLVSYQPGGGGNQWESGVPGPWVDESGTNEFFYNKPEHAVIDKRMTEQTNQYPKTYFHAGVVDDTPVNAKLNTEFNPPFGHQVSCFTNRKKPVNTTPEATWDSPSGHWGGSETPFSIMPEMILEPGNLYRIDVRFPVGVGTMDLGPDFARVYYSDDPLGDHGFIITTDLVGNETGWASKALAHLPFVRNGGEVPGFELTSWKNNPASSFALYGEYSTMTPVYFDEWNAMPLTHNGDGTYSADTPNDSLTHPHGIINGSDVIFWSNVGRYDLLPDVIDMVTGTKPMPPPRNPVYFEDFDQTGLSPTAENPSGLGVDGTKGDGLLDIFDAQWWGARGRTDVADQIAGFISSNVFPPKRSEIGSGEGPGTGNFGGGIFNLSASMDGDYTTALLQLGQLDTPDYVFQQLPPLPLQPWGLRYFEDFKAFGTQNAPFNGNFKTDGNALINFSENTFLTANMSNPDEYDNPITHIWSMDGKYAYKSLANPNEWFGTLNEIEPGKSYDVGIGDIYHQDIIFRNPFIADRTEDYGEHTIILMSGGYTTITFSGADTAGEDITFSEDDIGAWQLIQNQTGEYTGHVQDWIKRYISIREGGYGTNVSTFNSTYLPRSTTGAAQFGPLKPGYTSPPPMNDYPLLPNGMAYLEDFGSPSNDTVVNIGQFVGLGYPDYGDWLAHYTVDVPNNINHAPPPSPIGDGLPVFGPKAIQAGLMTLVSPSNWPSLHAALNQFKLVIPGETAEWRPVDGQAQIFPYSSGSYDIEYNMDTRGLDNQIHELPKDESFTIFGSTGEYPDVSVNPAEVVVYYRGNNTAPGTEIYIPNGWYIPRNSPIFQNGLQTNKAYFIQHQLPQSVYMISENIEINRTQNALIEHRNEFAAHNSGLCSNNSGFDGQPYIELMPRTLTEFYLRPIPGPSWLRPETGDGIINEWLYAKGFPILRQALNIGVPFLRDTAVSVADVINHIGFPKDRIAGIMETQDVLPDGRLANNIVKYLVPPVFSSAAYVQGNYTAEDWTGTLTEFTPGKSYNIYVWDEFIGGTMWPFFGNTGYNDMDANYFPTMPVGIDEWQDFDIDGDNIISVEDWNLWENPPSGPAREDIREYIQGWLTTDEWLIYFVEPPIQTEPYFEQVNLVDVNIPLITPDGQEKKNITETDVTVNYWPTGSFPKGSQIFTGSAKSSRKDYYIKVLSDHPMSSSADYLFDVSFGHYQSSGSKVGVGGIGATEAIYKTQLSNLEDVEKLELEQQPGEDLGFHISSGSTGVDKYVWSINFHRKKYGDKLNTGDWTLKLSGSQANGAGSTTIKLTDDSRNQDGTPTPAGKRYNIRSGSAGTLNQVDSNIYGWYYPEAGTMILGENMSEIIAGPHTSNAASTASVATYSHKTDATRKNSSGFYLNYGPTNAANSFKDQNYNNSLRLVNCMRNVSDDDGSILEGLTGVEEQTLVTYLCNIKPHQLNHSNNPTYTSYENYAGTGSVDFQPFYMMRNADMHGNPQSYVTQVNLHDEAGNVLATARLSKPMNKNADKEAMIKVKLTY